jgi:hypothetical protein
MTRVFDAASDEVSGMKDKVPVKQVANSVELKNM